MRNANELSFDEAWDVLDAAVEEFTGILLSNLNAFGRGETVKVPVKKLEAIPDVFKNRLEARFFGILSIKKNIRAFSEGSFKEGNLMLCYHTKGERCTAAFSNTP